MTVKKILAIKLVCTSIILGTSISCTVDHSDNLKDFEQNASLRIKDLGSNLKKELSASMSEGGPIAAINTCKIKAPEITSLLNNSDDIKIKRTSLRIRNPSNAPDDWEQKILLSFEDKLSSGTPMQELVYSEKNIHKKTTTLRMMRAIPMQPVCLNCHGDKKTMSKNLISSLEKNYPNDLATGFSIGEIRGAFSVSKTINN